MDDYDYPDDPPRHRRRTSGGESSEPREQRSRRKKSSDSSYGGGASRSPASSPPRSKKKKKKKKDDFRSSSEDALEMKIRAKSKRKPAATAAEDALEAKIRRKARKKAEREREEEKAEEGPSDDSYGDDDSYDEEWAERERLHRKEKGSKKYATAGPPSAAGGGDIRNRPPTQPGAAAARQRTAQAQLDPLRRAELARQEKERNRKEVNPRFAQMHETGQWGGLSKWEKYGIGVLVVAFIVAAVVLGVEFGSAPDTPAPTGRPTTTPSGAPSATPSMAPTAPTYREDHGLEVLTAASPRLTLPATPGELRGARARPDSTPQALAAAFVLYDDPLALRARDPRFAERYALATFYYQNGGCAGDWAAGASAGWLTGEDHCGNWQGIVCDLQRRVTEVNLARTYVTGRLPVEFGQLAELSTLDLSQNAMSGTVPAGALSMSKMYTIALSGNDFEGEFPFDEVRKGAVILDNLWIQENQRLTGTITAEYCRMGSITLDCGNMSPQPVYADDSDLTTFEQTCLAEQGGTPGEYTCNSDFPDPPSRPSPSPATAPSPPAICGAPAAGA